MQNPYLRRDREGEREKFPAHFSLFPLLSLRFSHARGMYHPLRDFPRPPRRGTLASNAAQSANIARAGNRSLAPSSPPPPAPSPGPSLIQPSLREHRAAPQRRGSSLGYYGDAISILRTPPPQPRNGSSFCPPPLPPSSPSLLNANLLGCSSRNFERESRRRSVAPHSSIKRIVPSRNARQSKLRTGCKRQMR